jgi:hypothetical protein
MSSTVEQERQRCIALSEQRGDFVTGDDGYVVYWPASRKVGALSPHHLRWLADELDRRNADWDAIVQNDPEIAVPRQGAVQP